MRKALLTLALVGLLVVPVMAQFPGMFMRGGVDGTQLLANESVQKELKLSEDQQKDVKAATEARTKAFAKAKEDEDREGFQKANETFTKAMKKVKEGLTSSQSKRLLQIEVQLATKRNSAKIFENPAVQKALKLTDKQKKTVKSTLSDLEKDVKELMEDAKGDRKKFGAAFKKMGEMGKEAFTTVTKSLDDDQKKAWKDLAGEKFEGKGFPFEMRGFGPRGKDKGGKKREKKDDF